jgi:hypothetical protein
MTLTELLADPISVRMIAQLLQQESARIRARVESPMSVNAAMRAGSGVRKREIPLMGGEEYKLSGIEVNKAAVFRRDDMGMVVKLAPTQVEEYIYFEHRVTTYGGGVSFGLTRDGETVLQGVVLSTVIETLLEEAPAANRSVTWRTVIESAVRKEAKKDAAQRLDSHDDFGSW